MSSPGQQPALLHDRHARTLRRCGVTDVEEREYDRDASRKYVFGKLNGFTFRFQNYYWVVKGTVPITIAEELYEHPVGKTDIRVSGHCGCPHPLEYGSEWTAADGRIVIGTDHREEFKKLEHLEGYFLPEEVNARYIFNDDPASIGATCSVDSYHIDSELALYIFINAVKEL